MCVCVCACVCGACVCGACGACGACVCLYKYPSKRIHVAACDPIGTRFGTHMEIHLEWVVGQIKISPVSFVFF